ncbi:MAG TPA: MFS transporter, partial [Spirochaetia bacterium]|nr:MFS transporter [Spirochaetia bacterium]
CGSASWILANSTVSLIPLYAMERGASAAGGGLVLSFAYLCLTLGTATGALLPREFSHRRFLVAACGVLAAVACLLVSRTTTLATFAAASGASWFLAGSVATQATIMTGLAAPAGERGRALGTVGMTGGLGSVIGGLGAGWLADRCGFASVYQGIAVVCVLMIAGGLLAVEAPTSTVARATGQARGFPRPRDIVAAFGVGFLLLLSANLLLSLTNASAVLGRALRMNQQGFPKLSINVTQSISGVVSLSLPLVLGWLSDRIGRKWILAGSYLVVSMGLLVLAWSHAFCQFGLFAALIAFLSVSLGIGPAFVLDVVPGRNAARGVSIFQSVFWGGNIAGTALLGLVYQRLGTVVPVIAAALLPVLGIGFLLPVRRTGARVAARGEPPTTPGVISSARWVRRRGTGL